MIDKKVLAKEQDITGAGAASDKKVPSTQHKISLHVLPLQQRTISFTQSV
jgi:hypothetical protein